MQAARVPEQPQGAAEVKSEPGGAQPQIKEELAERVEGHEVVAMVEPHNQRIPSLNELLSPEAWATATIRGKEK